jgi:CRISPR system Cascade subunit CasB
MTISTDSGSIRTVLMRDVTRRIRDLQEGYLDRRGSAAQARAQADLARLRSADPADPIAVPEAWPVVQGDSPEALAPYSGDEPTKAERARHCAMVLYSRHQQSQDQPMHVVGTSFPQAVRILGARRAAAGDDFDPNVRQRFDMALLSPTWLGRAEHLNALIRMLRGEGIGFDYGELCHDLFLLASPDGARRVRTRWARDLYRKPDTESGTLDTEADQPDSEGEL